MDEYPNDGSFYQASEPEEQVKERRVEQSKAQAAKPMLEDILAKITGDIDTMQRSVAINVTPETSPEVFMKAWYGVQEQSKYAQELKEYIEGLLLTTKR
jgi:hypothetical protein